MCIFCKIVKKEIPSYTLYEDETVLAFLDISQVTKGHTLVIPKKHTDNYLECDDETLAHLNKVAKNLGNKLMTKLNCEGMNILSNVNEVAGQSVKHFHLHLIPRYSENDAVKISFEESEKQNFEELLTLLK